MREYPAYHNSLLLYIAKIKALKEKQIEQNARMEALENSISVIDAQIVAKLDELDAIIVSLKTNLVPIQTASQNYTTTAYDPLQAEKTRLMNTLGYDEAKSNYDVMYALYELIAYNESSPTNLRNEVADAITNISSLKAVIAAAVTNAFDVRKMPRFPRDGHRKAGFDAIINLLFKLTFPIQFLTYGKKFMQLMPLLPIIYNRYPADPYQGQIGQFFRWSTPQQGANRNVDYIIREDTS